ncbi:MAG: hypothetical protein V7632_1452 [Bradyrhizobium sp.]|jgi:hypothetical protein
MPKKSTNYFAAPPGLAPSATAATQKSSAVNGNNTAPQANGGTANSNVSGPGVGVGHAANGRPIGSTGSGLGSPENPINGSQ